MAERRNTFGYALAGERIVSVTEVLKLAGLVDLSHIPVETLERARQRGHDVHAWVEGIALGLIDDETPDERIAPYIDGYGSFLAETEFTVVDVELEVVSRLYRFAGRLDLTGTIGGESWLLDVKATASIAPESALQTAGYAVAYRETKPEAPVHRRAVLQLGPGAGPRLYRLAEQKSDREDTHDFLAAVRVAYWKLRHGTVRALEG
jgi:hypothetical protein